MTQKILKVGSSLAVTIPKKSLQDLDWRAGDTVQVDVDTAKGAVSIRASKKRPAREKKITELTLNFIERYREDLEALARK